MGITSAFLFLFVYLPKLAGSNQIFVEEDGPFTISCPVNVSFTMLVPQVYPFNIPIAKCNKTICLGIVPGVNYLINSTGLYFTVILLDTTSLRAMEQVQCVYDGKIVFSYNISVVVKPQNVSCDIPILSGDNTNVKIICRTMKVYPMAIFRINVLSQTLSVSGASLCSSTNYTDIVLYYRTTCTWTSSLANFDAGNYSFNVSFYSSIIDDSTYEVNVRPIQVLLLSFPTVKLSSDCFTSPVISQGFIKPGSSINCMCYLETIGYPPGNVNWLNNVGMEIGIPLNTTAQILSTFESMDANIYNCSASTTLKNQTYFIPYKVNYAKGPSKCEVKPENSPQTVWDMCKNTNIKVPIVCRVNVSDVKPGIKSIIYINSTGSGELNNERINNTYRTKYEAIISEAGNITTSCQMQNSIFNDVTVLCSHLQVLQVIASPLSDPILKLNSNPTNTQQDVEENKAYVLECTVFGGVPPVSNVTVSCGNITGLTQPGHIFTSHVTFTKNMTGQNCTCTAEHITGCYENTFITTLNVEYSSIITSFTPQSTQTVEIGDSLKFNCAADGNPPPLINITKELELFNQTSSGYIVSFKKTMTCKDTGIFKCQAYNGINNKYLQTIQERTVLIYVKCSLQFNHSDRLIQEFNYHERETFSHRLIVFGYPEPSHVEISKLDRTPHNVNVSYSPLDPPYGTIELKILDLTTSDFSNYTLNIFQNGSPSLKYTFYIKEKPKNEPNVGATVGGTLAGLAVIILIILAIMVARKYSIKCSCACIKKSSIEKRQDSNNSELSVTHQHQDHHKYETPNISFNSSIDTALAITTRESSNYVNVKNETYQNTEKNLYDEIRIDNEI